MKNDVIVLYKSEYGFTKQYAQWIAEELKCDCLEISAFNFDTDFKTIIFGGGLYAGKNQRYQNAYKKLR